MLARFNGRSIPGQAYEALTECRFGNMDSGAADDPQISLADSGDETLGVIPESYAEDEAAQLIYDGIGYLEVDGTTAVAIGDPLKPKSDSSGVGVKVSANNDQFGARALEPVASGTKVIKVLIERGFYGA
jgi:hypothetical protein